MDSPFPRTRPGDHPQAPLALRWADSWPGAGDPNGQASIWYLCPGSTVTSDRCAVKMPTVPGCTS